MIACLCRLADHRPPPAVACQSHLGKSFSIAQYGNSIVAIVAGQVAERAANYAKFHPVSDDSGFYVGGYLGPFDISLITLIVCGVLASSLWEENYGDATTTDQGDDEEASKSDKSAAAGGLRAAFAAALRSPDIMACGVISSLFEGSMYIFVFMWTPALKALAQEELGDEFEGLPFGIIFSTFMVCCMAGASPSSPSAVACLRSLSSDTHPSCMCFA